MIRKKGLRIIKNVVRTENKLPKVVDTSIKLRVTAITPIHIGSGNIYEPTNFIIDNNILYEFRDEDFYYALPKIKQQAFMNIIKDNASNSFARINKFVKDNKDIAKKVANLKVTVTNGLQKEYDKVVGKIRQIEGRAGNLSRVFNQFEIQKIQRKQIKTENGYAHIGYIVGSSLKGAISTAYQEYIYKKGGSNVLREKFQSIDKNIFKEFKVSDSIVTKVDTKIGFALNKERFDYDFDNKQNNIKLSTYIEVINPASEFIVPLSHGSLDIQEILQSCNEHYMPIFKSILANETDGKEEFISEYLAEIFYDTHRHFKLKPNQYIIRVGKHSGARAITIDGMREIKSKISKDKSEIREDETTTWLFGEDTNSNSGLLPFGWMLCEIIK